MKKVGLAVLITVLLASCNDNGSATKGKIDSFRKDFDTSAGRIWDSTKEKAKDIKEKIEDRLDRKDTTGR